MPHLQIAYFRNAAYLNEAARYFVPDQQMISPSEFMKLHRNGQISSLASFQICNPQAEDNNEFFLADELVSYLVEIGYQLTD
jgi:hypothetical protein